MSFLNLIKPQEKNFFSFLIVGTILVFVSILDVFLNSFYDLNFTSALPSFLNLFLPLIIGFIGTLIVMRPDVSIELGAVLIIFSSLLWSICLIEICKRGK